MSAVLGAAAAAIAVASLALSPLIPSTRTARGRPSAAPLWRRALVAVRAARHADRTRREATRILRAAHGAIRSQVPVPTALARAVESSDDPFARAPFDDALAAFRLGAPLDAALETAAARLEPGLATSLRTLALGVSERLPLERVAALTGALADRLEFDERLADEVRARTAGVRGQVVLLAALVPALAAYLLLTVPGLAEVFGTLLGRAMLAAAVALEIAGIVGSRRAVRALQR